MSIRHSLELLRSKRDIAAGMYTSIFLIVCLMGWMAIAYARLNAYLLLIVFPTFNGIFITSIMGFLIRGENEALVTLQTSEGTGRKIFISVSSIALSIVVVLNIFFELFTIFQYRWLVEIFGQTFSPIEYVPDLFTLISFIGSNLSMYLLFITLTIWMFLSFKIIPAEQDQQLAKLEGVNSLKFLSVVTLIVVACMIGAFTAYSVIFSTGSGPTLEPLVCAMVSMIYNFTLSYLLWSTSWKSIYQKPAEFTS